MINYYILKDKIPVCVESFQEWAKWFESMENRQVLSTDLVVDGIPVRVSTVFLGISFNFDVNPVFALFESVVFGGELNNYIERYPTWDEAIAGHLLLLDRCRGHEL